MNKIVEVKAMEGRKVWIKFSDGVQGTVDLSHLAGKGVFSAWEDIAFFNSVFIDPATHTIAWDGGIDLCPDKLYAVLTKHHPL